MSAGNLGHSEVKAICDRLEISPSQHDESGHYGGKSKAAVKHSEAVTGKTHFSTRTSEFHHEKKD
jgi:hypothetical protein